MDQNSGDGEPNLGGSPQCTSKEKYAMEENCGVAPEKTFGNGVNFTSMDSPSSTANKATVFNLGAAPFISYRTNDSCASNTPPPSESVNTRTFPWNGLLTTSTPINGISSANHNNNTASPRNGGNVPLIRDLMELNNRLNSMSGLGTVPSALQKAAGKSMPMTTTTPSLPMTVARRGTPMPSNILRHLTNNNIMGDLLQETNPPPPPPPTPAGLLAPRNAAEYRAYFNSNIINGNNDINCLSNVPSPLVVAGQNGNFMHRPQSNGGVLALNNPGGGLYNYRFDLENDRQQRGSLISPSVQAPVIASPVNQFHRIRTAGGGCGNANIGMSSNNYGENNFVVTHANGIIQLKLKDGIEIEMTLDGAIRVVNWRCNVSIALASSSNSAALIHPNGRVLQYHSRVEIMTYDGKNKNNFVRFAKIWYKGISFTSENNALVYLVDSGGTRTTTDTFMDLRNDITEQVFLTGSTHGPAYDNQAKKEVMNHKYWPALDGTEVHELNGFRIAQTVDGMVRITKTNKNILVRTSPGNGSATLTTAYIHCTASLGQTSHLFVRRGERRMHFDGAEFVVRNSGHSAGFDSNNLLRVY